jgi:hypothetical protein
MTALCKVEKKGDTSDKGGAGQHKLIGCVGCDFLHVSRNIHRLRRRIIHNSTYATLNIAHLSFGDDSSFLVGPPRNKTAFYITCEPVLRGPARTLRRLVSHPNATIFSSKQCLFFV